MIAEVVGDLLVMTRATAFAAQLATGPSTAFGEAERLLRNSWEAAPDDVCLDEADTIVRLLAGSEASMLIDAFLGRS